MIYPISQKKRNEGYTASMTKVDVFRDRSVTKRIVCTLLTKHTNINQKHQRQCGIAFVHTYVYHACVSYIHVHCPL